jgi:glyoxylase-like metal-dependent hydrolase (beta-lactamase superfamily II)
MNEWKTKYGHKIIRVLSGRSNAYLILNGNTAILVDTGKKTAFRKLSENMETIDVAIETISYLILTHTHFDHCQSAKRIAEKSGCRIIVVKGDFYPDGMNDIIKIIETPGHSVDSISILVDNEVAIVGDAMFGIFKKSIFPPYADDTAKMIESWGKLLHTDCQIFLPGHGRAIKRILLQKEYDKYARKHNK